MNRLIFLPLIFVALSFQARAAVCGKFLPCGAYSGPMTDKDIGVIANESMTLAEGENDRLSMSGVLNKLTGEVKWKYNFELAFEDDGRFTIYAKGTSTVIGSGVCNQALCSYATSPSAKQALAGVLSFEGNILVRSHLLQDKNGETGLWISKMVK